MTDYIKNMKIIFYCWTCNKEYENVPLNKPYRCECGRYVVSPSGKTVCTILPSVPVWLIDDGERHWIAAKNQKEAIEFYENFYEERLDDSATVEKVSLEKLNNTIIHTDEVPPKLVSLMDIIREVNEFPILLASSVW